MLCPRLSESQDFRVTVLALFLPSCLQRYSHYVTNGIPPCMLATLPLQQIDNIMGLLPPMAGNSSSIQSLQDTLLEEVKAEYDFSLRKSIGTEQVHWLMVPFLCCTYYAALIKTSAYTFTYRGLNLATQISR